MRICCGWAKSERWLPAWPTINQPLCAIENYAQACLRLMERSPDMTRLGEVLRDIREQAERAGKIIHRVKGWWKKCLSLLSRSMILSKSIDW
jgi:C4-dicarboxylate-specific signal transduction histidine kinase